MRITITKLSTLSLIFLFASPGLACPSGSDAIIGQATFSTKAYVLFQGKRYDCQQEFDEKTYRYGGRYRGYTVKDGAMCGDRIIYRRDKQVEIKSLQGEFYSFWGSVERDSQQECSGDTCIDRSIDIADVTRMSGTETAKIVTIREDIHKCRKPAF